MEERPEAASLVQLLDELATAMPGIECVAVAGRVEYRRDGRSVALRGPTELRFRVGRAVAAAALTTPGARRAPEGAEWVALGIGAADRFSMDRVRAWFELAARGGR
ncbi:MAG: hypothetical protein H0X16_01965 [Chloroflexi bacterium]|nr:hypothetical protein [Chloroflexota bacterium]